MACVSEVMMQSVAYDKRDMLRAATIKQYSHCSHPLKGSDQWHELKEQYTLAKKGTHILKLPKDTEVAAVVYGELSKTQLSAPENILTVIVRFVSAITDNCGS